MLFLDQACTIYRFKWFQHRNRFYDVSYNILLVIIKLVSEKIRLKILIFRFVFLDYLSMASFSKKYLYFN